MRSGTNMTQPDPEAKTKLTRARISMIMKQPFFGQLAMQLLLVEDATLEPPTAAVDGVRLFYHPQWVKDHDQDVVEAMVAHEVGHCIFEHIGRRNGRTPRRWNHAGDYVINAMLKDCNFAIGADWLYNPIYAGLSTDQVYQALPPEDEIDGSGPGPFDKHFDTAPDDVDGNEMTEDWKHAVAKAANAAEEAGNVPGSLKRFINEAINGKADWRGVFNRFCTERAREDYSYRVLNRKFAAIGIFLPGLWSEAMGEMAMILDTSGSITEPIFSAFLGETDAIRTQMNPSVMHVLQCDCEMGHVDHFEQYDEFKVEPSGGGGTDFRPPFKYMEDNGIDPRCAVYLTDGHGSFPPVAPSYPVLWLMTTDVVPPWGEHVRIEL